MIYFREIKQSGTTLLPGSPLMISVFRKCYSSAAGLYLCPAGGEQYGMLLVAAVSSEEAQEMDEAIPALWKISYCIIDELPDKDWGTETITHAMEEYRKSYDNWLNCGQGKDFINWLKTNARETLRAQHELKRPVNQPVYLPDKNSVADAGLESLNFIDENLLCVILQNDWNDTAGLFKYNKQWILVSWSTSA